MLTFCTAKLDTTLPEGLHEFFDDLANYGKDELDEAKKPGRSWSKDELRLKSNPDLHKLWCSISSHCLTMTTCLFYR